MKYLKKFSTHSDYETFTGSTDFIRPNVSVCVNEKEVHYNTSNIPIVHEYVDLGLPSGTLWATENIKDSNGNELYFAWGETQGYTSGQVGTNKNFDFEGYKADYKYGIVDYNDEPNHGMTKYNTIDEKTVLDSEDDAATANWGSNWKMPTKEQFLELFANTEYELTTVNGVDGYLLTSTANTNSLFFPIVGFVGGGRCYCDVDDGRYWTSSVYDEYIEYDGGGYYNDYVFYSAYFAFIDDYYITEHELLSDIRCRGFSVRPVRASNS